MSRRKQMYELLEDMFESAEEGDKEGTLELNRAYEKLVPHVYHNPPTKLDLEYENCRQSLVMSVRFILNAKERLSEIHKPDD